MQRFLRSIRSAARVKRAFLLALLVTRPAPVRRVPAEPTPPLASQVPPSASWMVGYPDDAVDMPIAMP
ncbi:MAG TPA: hypothetical protein VJU15_06200 [Gemmatimonadales bacterium]|nr:hypothetical protein [Gemmatimonadales bacterium]